MARETKALELADELEAVSIDPGLCHYAVVRDLIAAAAELRRLAAVEVERDALKAELERIKALEPVGYVNTEETDFEWSRRPWMSTEWKPVIALGSKTND